MFLLSELPLEVQALRSQMDDGRAGAFACFEGRVRDHNEGKPVSRLEYEAYGELAGNVARAILQEAQELFEIYDCRCLHRVGLLEIGDVAVWVGVTAAHRQAAFAACRYIIDEIKHRVPIWKKEHYADGAAQWVNCAAGHGGCRAQRDGESLSEPSQMTGVVAQQELFSRQVILPQIGEAGQRRLQGSRVVVIGAGGLGCAVINYLAAAGVGTIAICDKDSVEISNLHRQTLFGNGDVGKSKAKTAAGLIAAKYPWLKVVSLPYELTENNVEAIVADHDLVLDCSDNFETRFVLNAACIKAAKPLIQSGVYQYEGQLSMVLPNGGGQCLACLWPDQPANDCVGTCADVGVVGPVVGVFGSLQALEAIKYICGIASELASNVFFFDLLNFQLRKVGRRQLPLCTVCGAGRGSGVAVAGKVSEAPVIAVGNQVQASARDWELDILDLSGAELKRFEIVDIREVDEDPGQILRALLRCDVRKMPLSQAQFDRPELAPDKNYLFVCQRGLRSAKFVAGLRARGYKNVFSLAGGVESVRRKFIA